jgi:hypothetical protein
MGDMTTVFQQDLLWMPLKERTSEGPDVGADYSTPVDSDYTVPFKFTGSIKQVVFHTGPMKISAQQWA